MLRHYPLESFIDQTTSRALSELFVLPVEHDHEMNDERAVGSSSSASAREVARFGDGTSSSSEDSSSSDEGTEVRLESVDSERTSDVGGAGPGTLSTVPNNND